MGATQAPPDHIIEALRKANEVKRKRPLLLRCIQTADFEANLRWAAEAVLDTPDLLGSMGVLNFLDAIHGVEFEEADGWMRCCDISPMASMRALRDDQRTALAAKLQEEAIDA